jgi:hypothetical protein
LNHIFEKLFCTLQKACGVTGAFFPLQGLRALDPLSIDPNERVTRDPDPGFYPMPDLPDLSIAVTDIGLIPPPPMFSSSPTLQPDGQKEPASSGQLILRNSFGRYGED